MSLLSFTALAIIPIADARDGTLLRYKFHSGETLRYVLTQNVVIKLKTPTREFSIANEHVTDLAWKVTAVHQDGAAEIAQTTERIRFKSAGGPNGDVDFDSQRAADAGPAADLFRVMIGPVIRFSFGVDGALTDVQIPPGLVERLRPAGAAAPVGDQLTEKGLKRTIAQSAVRLPPARLRKGETWTSDPLEVLDGGVNVTLRAVNTYEGMETIEDRRLDRFTRILTMELRVPKETRPGLEIRVKSQEGSGTVLFDNIAGVLVRSTSSQKLLMDVAEKNGSRIERAMETVSTLQKKP